MALLNQLFATCLLVLSLCAQAQQPTTPADTVGAKLEQIEREIAAIRNLDKELGDLQGLQAEILRLRLDNRVLRLMRQLDEAANLMSKLTDEDPRVRRLREWMVNDIDRIIDRVFSRLDRLGQRVGEEMNAMDELKGTDRIVASAEVDQLDNLRMLYLRALVRHLAVRGLLGLDNDVLKPRIEHELSMRGETLAGSVAYATAMLRDFRGRSTGEGARSDVEFLVNYTKDRRSRYLGLLEEVVVLMAAVGMDASEYQSILVSEKGVSFNAFNRSVLVELAAEWRESFGSFLSQRGPDVAFRSFLFVAIIVLFHFLARLVRWLLRGALGRTRADLSMLLKDTLVSIIGGSVMVVGILIALAQVGLSVGPMLAGLGIAGFIIGFALQDTLSNFASGAMILAYRPFDVDDFVEVAGASGVVKKMNLVSTTINTFDNQVLVVPNSKIWGDVIKNVTHQQTRRVDLEFGIGYEDDIEKAERILAELAKAHELVLDQPATNIRVHRLGDSSVVLILRPWVKTQDYWTVYWDLTRAVKLRFDAEGITIPYPQRTVHLLRGEKDERLE